MSGIRVIKKFMPIRLKEFVKELMGIKMLERNAAELREQSASLMTNIFHLGEHLAQVEQRLYESQDNRPVLQRAVGMIDIIEYDGETLGLSGWIMLPQQKFDSFFVYINGEKVGKAQVRQRKDVSRYLPWCSDPTYFGFAFSVSGLALHTDKMTDIAVVGSVDDVEIGRIETWYRPDLKKYIPVPPDNLILRSIGRKNPPLYLIGGLYSYRDFWTALARHTNPGSITSMLDWGCGCGRITACFTKFSEIPHVCGCDVDGEAIAWCQENLKPAEFSVIEPYPPTPYPDGSFQLIISRSVMTHLTKEVQLEWLKEMARILAPGGLFIPTLHGEFAYHFVFPMERGSSKLLPEGISDSHEDTTFDGIVPKGYYRGTFQTKEYVLREWSKYFDVLEYRKRGSMNFQDMVVLRKKPS